MKMIRNLIIIIALFAANLLQAQISSAKVTYERKTNLYKKMKGDNIKNWIKEADKIKLDYFELYFNDTCSVFKPQESELKENFSWATQKSTVYQNFNNGQRYTIKDMWGEQLHIKDSLRTRTWHITESTR